MKEEFTPTELLELRDILRAQVQRKVREYIDATKDVIRSPSFVLCDLTNAMRILGKIETKRKEK